jgi:hypothetical protein
MEYVPLYTTTDLGESAFLESLFKANGIHYSIPNEIGSRFIMGTSFNQRTFYVSPEDLKSANLLLKQHLKIEISQDRRWSTNTYIFIAAILFIFFAAITIFIAANNPVP